MTSNADRLRDLIRDTAAPIEDDSAVFGTVLEMAEALDHYTDAVNRMVKAFDESFAREDRLIAELRDDLHAVVMRVESLSQAVSRR